MNKISRKDLGKYSSVHLIETKRLKVNGRWSKKMGKAPICVNAYPGKKRWDKFNVVGFNIMELLSGETLKSVGLFCPKCIKKYAKKKRKEDYPGWLKVYLGNSVPPQANLNQPVYVEMPWGQPRFRILVSLERESFNTCQHIVEVPHRLINKNVGSTTLNGFRGELEQQNPQLFFENKENDWNKRAFIYRVWQKEQKPNPCNEARPPVLTMSAEQGDSLNNYRDFLANHVSVVGEATEATYINSINPTFRVRIT